MLTSDGAGRLRAVRDHIRANPELFDWGSLCGSRCCIAGHLVAKFAPGASRFPKMTISESAAHLIGVSRSDVEDLFYGFDSTTMYDVEVAAKRIDAFLWQYGYPPNEIDLPEPVADPVDRSLLLQGERT